MAGIDYSNVHEPDYNREKLKQPRDITEYIKKVSEIVYNSWKDKDNLYNKDIKGKDYIPKTKANILRYRWNNGKSNSKF